MSREARGIFVSASNNRRVSMSNMYMPSNRSLEAEEPVMGHVKILVDTLAVDTYSSILSARRDAAS